jgi:hypothetical protein
MSIKSFNEYLTELSMGRVWSYFQDLTRTAGIISASRQGRTAKENADATMRLAGEVRSAGFGYVFADGHWIETKDDGSQVPVKETSLIIRGNQNDNGQLKGYLRKWLHAYDQEGAIYKPEGVTYVIVMTAYGPETRVGYFHPDRAGEMMTKLRGHGGRTFVFESAYTPMTWMQRVLHAAKKRNNS